MSGQDSKVALITHSQINNSISNRTNNNINPNDQGLTKDRILHTNLTLNLDFSYLINHLRDNQAVERGPGRDLGGQGARLTTDQENRILRVHGIGHPCLLRSSWRTGAVPMLIQTKMARMT